MATTPPTQPMADTAQRHAQILGTAPRIPALAVDELTDDLADLLTRMIAINTVIDSRDVEMLTDLMPADGEPVAAPDMQSLLANLPELMRTMLRHPALFARQVDIGMQLLGKGLLPARDRELAILRIGWLCQAPYEWGEHCLIAKKLGITSEEIERITLGSAAPGWSEHDAALLRAAEELHADAMISDATWATLSKRFDAQQLIELPALIGQYQAVAYSQNSLRLRLHDGNLGLNAR
jgi:alkylhydroperoxidase family enzyme